jgi:hypothetical protein
MMQISVVSPEKKKKIVSAPKTKCVFENNVQGPHFGICHKNEIIHYYLLSAVHVNSCLKNSIHFMHVEKNRKQFGL